MHRIIPVIVLLFSVTTVSGQEPSKAEKAEGFVSIFNGKDFTGWEPAPEWEVNDAGTLICKKTAKPQFRTLRTKKEYSDFVLRLDYLLTEDCNNGIALRTDPKFNPNAGLGAQQVLEVQLVDKKHVDRKDPKFPKAKKDPKSYTPGALYGIKEASTWAQKEPEKWNSIEIVAKGPHIRVVLNGQEVVNHQLDPKSNFRGQNRTSGHIGLCGWVGQAEFKNIRIRELK